MNKKDKLLGIDRSITRRDFVGSMLLGTGAVLLGSQAPSKILYNKRMTMREIITAPMSSTRVKPFRRDG